MWSASVSANSSGSPALIESFASSTWPCVRSCLSTSRIPILGFWSGGGSSGKPSPLPPGVDASPHVGRVAVDRRGEPVELLVERFGAQLSRAARTERREDELAEPFLLLGVERGPRAHVGADAHDRERRVGHEVG